MLMLLRRSMSICTPSSVDDGYILVSRGICGYGCTMAAQNASYSSPTTLAPAMRAMANSRAWSSSVCSACRLLSTAWSYLPRLIVCLSSSSKCDSCGKPLACGSGHNEFQSHSSASSSLWKVVGAE